METHAAADAAGGGGPAEGYRAALYLGMGLAGMALVIGLVFGRMPKDTREGRQLKDAVPDVSSGGGEESLACLEAAGDDNEGKGETSLV